MMIGSTDGSQTTCTVPDIIGLNLEKFDSKYGLVDEVPSFMGFEIEFSNGLSCDHTAIANGLIDTTDYDTKSYTAESKLFIGFRAIFGPDSSGSGNFMR